jgi:hypothetical protein
VGGISFWPTPLTPTVAPTLPVPGAAFPGVMWWGPTPTFPTFTPTVAPTFTPAIPAFTPVVTPTFTPFIPTLTPTVAPTIVPTVPFAPVAPIVPLVPTAPAPLTIPLGWPTAVFAPTTVPITGALWPAAATAPFI